MNDWGNLRKNFRIPISADPYVQKIVPAGLWLLEAKQLLICAQEGSQILGISGLKFFRPPFFQNPKWPPPPFWKFCDITKIMSDIPFPMYFDPLNTMKVLIFRFEYKLTPESPINGFILVQNIFFGFTAIGLPYFFRYIVCYQKLADGFSFKKYQLFNFCIYSFWVFMILVNYFKHFGALFSIF